MSSVDRLRRARGRDLEASGQFFSKFWLESFLFAERQIEAAVELAAGCTGVPDAEAFDEPQPGAQPPALLLALDRGRQAVEQQYRLYFELAWIGARLAARQRIAFARLAADGVQALNEMALAGLAATPVTGGGGPAPGARSRHGESGGSTLASVVVTDTRTAHKAQDADASRPVVKPLRPKRARSTVGPAALAVVPVETGSRIVEAAHPASARARAVAAAGG